MSPAGATPGVERNEPLTRTSTLGTVYDARPRMLVSQSSLIGARSHLLIGEDRPGGRVQLRKLLRDGAIVAHAAAAARAELHEQLTPQPGAHLRVDAVPVGRHVAVIAREGEVVVGRAERRSRVAREERHRLAAAVRQIRIRRRRDRHLIEVLRPQREVVGEEEVPPPAAVVADVDRHARQDLAAARRRRTASRSSGRPIRAARRG